MAVLCQGYARLQPKTTEDEYNVSMGFCKYHGLVHTPRILEDFTKHCERLKIPVPKGDCPVRLIMEGGIKAAAQAQTLEPEYQIFNDSPTKIAWPRTVDLLITKLPATEKDGFTKGLAGFIANKAFTAMNPNSLAYVIVSSFKEDKARPFAVVDIFVNAGFNFVDSIVWLKNKFIPTQGSKRLNNVYDFVFFFSKGDNYHLNRPSVSYLKKNVRPDEESTSDEYLCPGNAWAIKIADKDTTPVELIDCLIKLSNVLPNSVIVDPFMDTGAVLQAALQNGHSFWGTETEKAKFKKCKAIVEKFRGK